MSLRLLTSSLRPLSRPVLARPTALPQPFLSASRLYSTPAADVVDEAAKKLKDELKTALKTAMKARDGEKTGIVKSLIADVTYFEKSFSPPVQASAEQVMKVIQKSIGRRKESAEQYTAANRQDLADKELGEIEFINQFLPVFMPLEKISPILSRLAETLSSEKGSSKALGGLLGAFYKEVGRTAADSKVVTKAAKELLGLK